MAYAIYCAVVRSLLLAYWSHIPKLPQSYPPLVVQAVASGPVAIHWAIDDLFPHYGGGIYEASADCGPETNHASELFAAEQDLNQRLTWPHLTQSVPLHSGMLS